MASQSIDPAAGAAVVAQPDAAVAGNASQSMLDALASIGMEAAAITYTDLSGAMVRYWPSLPVRFLRERLQRMIAGATPSRHNVIIRPEPSAATALIQLDDIPAAMVDRLRPVSFMALETSHRNFQAWIAVAAADADTDLARRLRIGTSADPNASGAARLAGSGNFKPEYAPAFPVVQLVHAAPGRIISRHELEELGVIAPPEEPAPFSAAVEAIPSRRTPVAWPDYQRCQDGAPLKHDGSGPDRSRADYFWCLLAAQWGWGIEATAQRLMELSSKALENGEGYAWRTATNAAAVERRREG